MSEITAVSYDSPEARLIIACSQRGLPPEHDQKILDILRHKLDWGYILQNSFRNGVFPLVSDNLLRNFEQFLPQDVISNFQERLAGHVRNNMFLTSQLLEIVRLFNSESVPFMPFKGPLLAMTAYGNLALRQFVDLDVLIQPQHLERSIKLLKTLDFAPIDNLSWLNRTNRYMSRNKDIYLTNSDRSVNLELHWKLSGSHFAMPIEVHRLWEQVETVNFAGVNVKSLSFNDLFIYLSLHGTRHSWERFGWICDINELLRSKQDIDWEIVSREAKRLGCENILELTLRLVYEFFGTETNIPRWEKIKKDKSLDPIVVEIQQRLFSSERVPVKIGDRYLYHLKLKERSWDKWKLHLHYLSWYLRIILVPNEIDKNLVHLPPSLAPLYYVTRPIRLLNQHLGRRREK